MSHTMVIGNTATIAGKVLGANRSATNDGLAVIDTTAPIGTNVEYEAAFTVAQIKSLAIYAAVACTIKTNSSSEPDDTITMVAGEIITWDENSVYACPITADVTSLFLTNAASGLIQFYALYDPTA